MIDSMASLHEGSPFALGLEVCGSGINCMLQELHIRNLVIVSEARLQFGEGLTVISGETGAGKSLLLDALGLVMGKRAANLVGPDDDACVVSASYELSEERVAEILGSR